jgi:hypothetical protein
MKPLTHLYNIFTGRKYTESKINMKGDIRHDGLWTFVHACFDRSTSYPYRRAGKQT